MLGLVPHVQSELITGPGDRNLFGHSLRMSTFMKTSQMQTVSRRCAALKTSQTSKTNAATLKYPETKVI